MASGAPWWGRSCMQPVAGRTHTHARTHAHTHTPERLRNGRPGGQYTAPGLTPWVWARRQPGAPRHSPVPPSFERGAGEWDGNSRAPVGAGCAESQAVSYLTLTGCRGQSSPPPQHTPSIPSLLAHAGSQNAPCGPSSPSPLPTSGCSSPARKSAHISVAFQILIWSLQLRAAAWPRAGTYAF